jgi:peptidoglycan hydrolase-like protein with peptidoglycan-binding domain
MKRFVTYLVSGALVLEAFFVPMAASAQTATSTASIDSMIAQLEGQLKTLQAQIEALRAARAQVQTTATQTAQLIRQLREGMSGDDVRLLQVLLATDSDIYPEALVTGLYGKLTAKAVRKFQQKHGLPQVGQVGPLTLEQLKKLLNNYEFDDDDDDDRGSGRRILCYRIIAGNNVPPGWARKDREGKQFIKKCGDFATSTPPTTPPTSDTTAPVIS